MKFIRIVPNDKVEYQLNLDKLIMVQVTGSFCYLTLLDRADKLMIPAAEWQRIEPLFSPKLFPRIPESESKQYVVNLDYVTLIEVTSGLSYMYVHGFKERIMLKPEVWSEISILFPAQ